MKRFPFVIGELRILNNKSSTFASGHDDQYPPLFQIFYRCETHLGLRMDKNHEIKSKSLTFWSLIPRFDALHNWHDHLLMSEQQMQEERPWSTLRHKSSKHVSSYILSAFVKGHDEEWVTFESCFVPMRDSLVSSYKQGYMIPLSSSSNPRPQILMLVNPYVASCWRRKEKTVTVPMKQASSGLVYIVSPHPSH